MISLDDLSDADLFVVASAVASRHAEVDPLAARNIWESAEQLAVRVPASAFIDDDGRLYAAEYAMATMPLAWTKDLGERAEEHQDALELLGQGTEAGWGIVFPAGDRARALARHVTALIYTRGQVSPELRVRILDVARALSARDRSRVAARILRCGDAANALALDLVHDLDLDGVVKAAVAALHGNAGSLETVLAVAPRLVDNPSSGDEVYWAAAAIEHWAPLLGGKERGEQRARALEVAKAILEGVLKEPAAKVLSDAGAVRLVRAAFSLEILWKARLPNANQRGPFGNALTRNVGLIKAWCAWLMKPLPTEASIQRVRVAERLVTFANTSASSIDGCERYAHDAATDKLSQPIEPLLGVLGQGAEADIVRYAFFRATWQFGPAINALQRAAEASNSTASRVLLRGIVVAQLIPWLFPVDEFTSEYDSKEFVEDCRALFTALWRDVRCKADDRIASVLDVVGELVTATSRGQVEPWDRLANAGEELGLTQVHPWNGIARAARATGTARTDPAARPHSEAEEGFGDPTDADKDRMLSDLARFGALQKQFPDELRLRLARIANNAARAACAFRGERTRATDYWSRGLSAYVLALLGPDDEKLQLLKDAQADLQRARSRAPGVFFKHADVVSRRLQQEIARLMCEV